MKRFCLLLVCLLILPMFFVGCNKDNKNNFIEVQSITYSIGDEITTLNSTFSLKYETSSTTQSEFNNAQLYYSNFEYQNYLRSQIIDISKENLNIALNTTITPGTYYLASDTDWDNENDRFVKWIIQNKWDIKYIKVKIISDNIIEIQNHKNEISRIKTDNYQINYFI